MICRKLVFLLLILNSSCMLQDDGTHFVPVEQVSDPKYIADITFSFTGIGKYYPVRDTFWLASGENLSFNFSGGGHIFRVMAEVDAKTVFDEEHNTTIWIDSKGLTKGLHELKITQFITSGSGSLADKLNVETASHTRSFVLVIGDLFTFTPAIQSVTVTETGAKIQWAPYHRSNFQAYEIWKYPGTTTSFESYVPHRKFIIKDPAQTSFIDTTYVGGIVKYIVAVDKGGTYFVSMPKQVDFQYKLHLRLSPTGAGRAMLSWDTPPLYKNIRSMSVRMTEGLSETKLADNISPGLTSVEINHQAPFGQLKEFSLRIQADTEGESLYYDSYPVFERLMVGTRTPPISNIKYNLKDDSYYLVNNSSLAGDYPVGVFRLDHNLRITDSLTSISGLLIASPDGNKIFLVHQSSVVEFKSSPLSIKQSYNFNLSNGQDISITNNNYIHYRTADKVNILDITTGNVLFSSSRGSASHLSPDGQYLINGADLYKFDGAGFQIASVLPFSDVRYVHFLPSGDRLFIASASKAIVYDYQSRSQIAEFVFPTSLSSRSGFNDLTTTYFTREAALTLLNISTGEQKVVPVYQADAVTIEGDYLFAYTGFGLNQY